MQKAVLLSSIGNGFITSNGFSVEEFIRSTKNVFLTQDIIGLLSYNWCYQKVGTDTMYLKHIYNEEENELYQIILSDNSDFSGVYKMELKGKDFNCKYEKESKTFKISSNNFFELAPFYKSKNIIEILREDSSFEREIHKMLEECDVDHIIFYNKEKKSYIKNSDENVFRTKTLKYLNKNNKTITGVAFVEKKKEYYISGYDLHENELKEQLINLGYVTKEEYEKYANKSHYIENTILIDMI